MLETADFATDPNVEQDPEVQRLRQRGCKGREGKEDGETARNRKEPDGVTDSHETSGNAGFRRYERGVRLRWAEKDTAGNSASQAEGNAVNPGIGSRLKHICKQLEEKAVGEVRNLRDGTGKKVSQPFFRRGTGNREPGVDSSGDVDERASLENPKRGNQAFQRLMAERSVGKEDAKGQRVILAGD